MFPPLPVQRQALPGTARASASLDPLGPAEPPATSGGVLTALRAGSPDVPPVAFDATFDDLFDRCPGGMFVAAADDDGPGRLIRTNAALTRITGYSGPQLATMTLADLTHPAEHAAHQRWLAEVADGRRTHVVDRRRWRTADGRELVVRLNAWSAGDGAVPLLFGMVDDLTDRVPPGDRFPEQSAHDPLTGLPDGESVARRIGAALRSAEHSGRPIAVLHVELDDLDVSRDVFGPAVGDQLVVLAARRLAQNIRPGDVLGRGGPSHFVVVCPDFPRSTDDEPALDAGLDRLVERFRSVLTAPCRLGGIVHHLPFRIARTASQPGNSVADVQHALAAALAAVPERPVHGAQFRTAPVLLGSVAAARHVDLENELLTALDEDQLVMFGQPVVTVATGRIGAVEMLIRWRHPVRGLLGPADFLDVAESSPLMEQVGRRVLRESCRMAAAWTMPDGSAPPAVFVNVSGRQLGSGRLCTEVAEALRLSGLAADRLVLELTETQAPLIGGAVLADLVQLRADGVRLAIDDVGTGYSTLARLTELPVDILKVDRVFVAGMQHRRSADAVVRAIVEIGRSLDIPVVAEGVETSAQAAAVRSAGCQLVQGFLFARPCPEADLATMLAEGALVLG